MEGRGAAFACKRDLSITYREPVQNAMGGCLSRFRSLGRRFEPWRRGLTVLLQRDLGHTLLGTLHLNPFDGPPLSVGSSRSEIDDYRSALRMPGAAAVITLLRTWPPVLRADVRHP